MAMNPADPTHQRIDQMVKAQPVLLFMKGNRTFPQCGFSASVVGTLNEIGVPYETFNILDDVEVRDGAKSYSDWPTFPQLYVAGELVGGADIVRSMFGSGELHKAMGVQPEEIAAPDIKITDWAAEVLREAQSKEKHKALRVEVSANFQYGLLFAADRDGDFVLESNGFTIYVDRASAKRANGLVLDYSKENKGFLIENPNEPPKVKQKTVRDLKKALDENPRLALYDVRTAEERQQAMIPGSKMLTPDLREQIKALPKDTQLWFSCKSGGRSNAAAEQLLALGFTDVNNVSGGIDAWSREIDPSVARY